MKTKKFLLSLLGLSVAAAGYAQATYTWKGTEEDADFLNLNNWDPVVAEWAFGDILQFDGSDAGPLALTVNDAGQNRRIRFNLTAGQEDDVSITLINATAARNFRIVENTAPAAQNIAIDMAAGAGGLTFDSTHATNVMRLMFGNQVNADKVYRIRNNSSNDLVFGANTLVRRAVGNVILNFIGTGTTRIQGQIEDLGAAASSGLRQNSASGTLSLEGDWTNDSVLEIYQGTVAFNSTEAIGGSNDTWQAVQIGQTNLTGTLRWTGTSDGNMDRQVEIGDGTQAAHSGGARIFAEDNGGTITFGNANFNKAPKTIGANTPNRLLDLDGPGSIVIEGIIADNSATANVGLRTDAGLLTLNGDNTFSGNINMRSGTVALGHNNAAGTGNIQIRANQGDATLRLADGLDIGNDVVVVRNQPGQQSIEVTTGDTAEISGVISISGANDLPTLWLQGGGTLILSGDNTFEGTMRAQNGVVRAAHNNAFGTGNVLLTSAGTVELADGITIGNALATGAPGGTGTKILALQAGASSAEYSGNIAMAGNVGGLTVNTGSGDLTISGNISGVNVQNNLVVGGTGQLILEGASTHRGNTNVTVDAALTLADGASMTFYIGDDGENNSITGTGTLALDGQFIFDLTDASTIEGHSWTIVASGLTETSYGGTFSVAGFTNDNGVWTSGDNQYQFSQSTGELTVVPEPATYALIGGLLALGAVLIRRRMK